MVLTLVLLLKHPTDFSLSVLKQVGASVFAIRKLCKSTKLFSTSCQLWPITDGSFRELSSNGLLGCLLQFYTCLDSFCACAPSLQYALTPFVTWQC